MSGHNKDTEMRIDWVGGIPDTAILHSGYSFEPGLLLHHSKFYYESVLMKLISFNMTVSPCQLDKTMSESCLENIVLLSYPIYFGDKSACRSFATGKMAEYRKIQ